MNNWSALPNGTRVISTVIFGCAVSKSLTALVKATSSLLSAAKVCHASIVIGPSLAEEDVSSSLPKSKQPGTTNSITMTVANILGKGSRLPFPLSIDWRLVNRDKRGLANLLVI